MERHGADESGRSHLPASGAPRKFSTHLVSSQIVEFTARQDKSELGGKLQNGSTSLIPAH